MKKLAILLAASVIGTAAYAQTTVIQKEDGLAGSRTVVAVSGCCQRSASSSYGTSSQPRPASARK